MKKAKNVAAGFSGGYSAIVKCERPVDPEPLVSSLRSDIKSLVKPVIEGSDYLKRDCVIVVGDKSFSIHSAQLALLSQPIRTILLEKQESSEKMFEDGVRKILVRSRYADSNGQSLYLVFDGIPLDIVRSFVEYLYTGSIDSQLIFSLECSVRKELNAVFALLQINVNQYEQPDAFIRSNIKKLFTEEMAHTADVLIRVKDGSLPAHRHVLATRTAFFKVLFGDDTPWSCPIEEGKRIVRLPYITKDVFQIFLSWIYDSQDLFSKTECEDISSFTEFVVEVLRASEEFLMYDVKELCARTLIKVMTLQNVTVFFGIAKEYRLKTLNDACLEFGMSSVSSELAHIL